MSKFWDKLSAEHKEQLKGGAKGFRNTVATRYFTDGKHNTKEYIKSIVKYIRDIDIDDSLFGDPVYTVINGHKVTQDLVNSIFEIETMGIDFNNIESVCEVGAGYGRTAYALLKYYPHLKYTIIDIPPALDLAKAHLNKEFPDADITYLNSPGQFFNADVYIAISVLTELSKEEIKDYFEMFNTGKYLYFRDWKSKHNPDNGTYFQDSFPVPENWKRIFKLNDPIARHFYNVMYKI